MRKFIKSLIGCTLVIALLTNDFFTTYAASLVTTVSPLGYYTTLAATNNLKSKIGNPTASYTIPGLKQTVTKNSRGQIVTCDSFSPQAITLTPDGKYRLISACCECANPDPDGENHNAVIYVVETATNAYKTTIILDKPMHAGGIACTDGYLWVCDYYACRLRAYKLSDITSDVRANYKCVNAYTTVLANTAPSYLCSYNNRLYVGTFEKDYEVVNIYMFDANGASLNYAGFFTIEGIKRIQGISVYGNYMMITRSYGRHNKSYIHVFKDTANKFRTKGVRYKKNGNGYFKRIENVANMMQGCYIVSGYTYLLFESGCKKYLTPSSGYDSTDLMPYDKYSLFSNDYFFYK